MVSAALRGVSQELSQLRERDIEGLKCIESMLFAVEVSFARISQAQLKLVSGQLLGDLELVNKGEVEGREGAEGCGAALAVS